MNDLYYRKNQLEQLQTQVVDLEDVNGSISITDLTFNDYKMDLMEALKTQRKNLEKAPKGCMRLRIVPPLKMQNRSHLLIETKS